MEPKLGPVSGWQEGTACVPTTLAAISGKTPAQIVAMISEVANDSSLTDAKAAFSGKHWLPVLEKLGFDHAIGEDASETPYESRSTIRDRLAAVNADELELIYCENADGSATHVFALCGSQLVDTYTNGKVTEADPSAVSDEYNAFRVKRTYIVFSKSNAATEEPGG